MSISPWVWDLFGYDLDRIVLCVLNITDLEALINLTVDQVAIMSQDLCKLLFRP